jgi:tetratricopeptide (TPR) repeat protein
VRAGERAFGLNAFASAARFFEEALELGVADDERPHVLFRLGTALHRSVGAHRIERLEEARDEALAAGDPETAAEACVILAEAWWDHGQNERGREQLERARGLIDGRPASAAVARVLLEVSRYAMLADETDEAVRTGRGALEMAEALGLTDLVPGALINIGSARGNAGDDGGIADLERAMEIAKATNNPDLARAYNNRAAMESNLQRAYEWQLLAKEAAERLGHGPVGSFVEGQLLMSSFDLGRWDEFKARAGHYLAACEAGSPNYNEVYVRDRLAELYVARDDEVAAGPEAARALALAREIKEPQSLQPALSCHIRTDLALGRLESARELAREFLSLLERGVTTFGMIRLALEADVLGVRHEVTRVLDRLPDRSSVHIAAAVLEGDFKRAADIAAGDGWLVEEAELRLRAAETLVAKGRRAEADVQLQKALAFYRSVGATRFIRKGEALLAATA